MDRRIRDGFLTATFIVTSTGIAQAQTNPPPSNSATESATNRTSAPPENEGAGLGTLAILLLLGVAIAIAIYFVVSRKRRSVTTESFSSGPTGVGNQTAARTPDAPPRNPGITISGAPK